MAPVGSFLVVLRIFKYWLRHLKDYKKTTVDKALAELDSGKG